MKKLAIALLAVLLLSGCEGWGGKASCRRNADGSVECSIEAHRDGKHEEAKKP